MRQQNILRWMALIAAILLIALAATDVDWLQGAQAQTGFRLYLPLIARGQGVEMTQASRPQQGRQVTYPDAGGYTANQWARIFRLLVRDYTGEGPFYAYLDALEVSNPSGVTIRVASGAALVNGHFFLNEDETTPTDPSNVDFTPSTPAADRIDRVVVVQNNTDSSYDGTTDYGAAVLEFPTVLTDYESTASVPAHSSRLAILTGVSGGAMRSLTQDVALDGDIWMIELARYTITSAPAISVGPTDYREFVDAETKQVFIPAVAAYNVTDGTVIEWDADVKGYYLLPDAKTSRVTGFGVFPADYISGGTISPLIRPEDGGDAYIVSVANYYGLDSYIIDSDSAAISAVTLNVLGITGYIAAGPITVTTTPSVPSGYQGIKVYTERRAADPLDTIDDDIRIIGWLLEYLGYRR